MCLAYVLSVFLFNVTTDDLEEGSDYVSTVDRPAVAWEEEEEDSFFAADPDPEPDPTDFAAHPELWPSTESSAESFRMAPSSFDDPSSLFTLKTFSSPPRSENTRHPPGMPVAHHCMLTAR